MLRAGATGERGWRSIPQRFHAGTTSGQHGSMIPTVSIMTALCRSCDSFGWLSCQFSIASGEACSTLIRWPDRGILEFACGGRDDASSCHDAGGACGRYFLTVDVNTGRKNRCTGETERNERPNRRLKLRVKLSCGRVGKQ